MNFAIRYLTEYAYEGRVTDNLNALRVRPATTSTQRVDDFHVRVDPEARLQRLEPLEHRPGLLCAQVVCKLDPVAHPLGRDSQRMHVRRVTGL